MQFDFSFLGNRDYVYSASIYNALMAHLKGVKCTDFELSCHKIARFNCQISENKPANLSEICFVAKFKKDGKITQIYGTENTNSPILKREDYDEDEIFKRAKIDFEDKSVSLQIKILALDFLAVPLDGMIKFFYISIRHMHYKFGVMDDGAG